MSSYPVIKTASPFVQAVFFLLFKERVDIEGDEDAVHGPPFSKLLTQEEDI